MGRCNRVLVKNGKNVASDGVDLLQGNAHAVGKITPIARIGHVRGLDFVGEGLVMDMGQTDSSAFDLPEHFQVQTLVSKNQIAWVVARTVQVHISSSKSMEQMGVHPIHGLFTCLNTVPCGQTDGRRAAGRPTFGQGLNEHPLSTISATQAGWWSPRQIGVSASWFAVFVFL